MNTRTARSSVLAGLVMAAVALMAPAAHADSVPACPTEDSIGPCHWDAQHQGNGKGTNFTVYRHHRTVTGRVALTLRQVRNVERIVHKLPMCRRNQASQCRVFTGHHHTLASFPADGHIYFVGMVRGQLAHVEVYSR